MLTTLVGFGYHADFIMGWDEDLLQNAVNTCTNPSGQIEDCPLFNIQSEQDQTSCQLKQLPQKLVKEDVTGIVGDSLPGNVAIQYGPQPATQVNPPQQTTTVAVPSVGYSAGTTATSSGSVLPGQVFKETSAYDAATAPTPSATPDAAASPDNPALIVGAANIESAPGVPSSTAASAAPAPTASPEPTAAPAAAPVDDGLPIVRTEYITNGNIVSEIVWKEQVVYVTRSSDVTLTTTVQAQSSVVAVRRLRRGHGHEHAHLRRHVGPGRG